MDSKLGNLLNQTRQLISPHLNAPHYKIERNIPQILELSKHLAQKTTTNERDSFKGYGSDCYCGFVYDALGWIG